MKNHLKLRSAFTLVEMLVVIAIMSLLVTALVSALKSAQRQARAALCQAHLKNLHQACMNYLADTGSYPYAGSYERRNPHTLDYEERKGWVAWVRADKKMVGDLPFNPWAVEPEKTHAEDYLHAGYRGDEADRSIKEGSIFKYTSRDMSTFLCKSFSNEKDLRRSYAMNAWFGSRRNELWRARKLLDFQSSNREPSRMGYIAELLVTKSGTAKNIGEVAGTDLSKRKAIEGDSVWETDDDELYGCYHRKAGIMHGHVLFVDGHIESLTALPNEHGDDYATQNTKLGNATH